MTAYFLGYDPNHYTFEVHLTSKGRVAFNERGWWWSQSAGASPYDDKPFTPPTARRWGYCNGMFGCRQPLISEGQSVGCYWPKWRKQSLRRVEARLASLGLMLGHLNLLDPVQPVVLQILEAGAGRWHVIADFSEDGAHQLSAQYHELPHLTLREVMLSAASRIHPKRARELEEPRVIVHDHQMIMFGYDQQALHLDRESCRTSGAYRLAGKFDTVPAVSVLSGFAKMMGVLGRRERRQVA